MKTWTKIAGLMSLAIPVVTKALEWRAEQRNPPLGDFMECDGQMLHYIDRGPPDAPAVVFFHGNGAMIQDFAISGILDLAAKKYRVICFDRPGYGYSERPRGVDWTPEAQARLFARAMRQLRVEKAVVLGHSWGTLVAVALAVQAPDLVRALVLASGYYFPTPRKDVVALSVAGIPGIGDVLRWTVMPILSRATIGAALKLIFSPRPIPKKFLRYFPLELALRPESIRASAEEAGFMVPAVAELQQSYPEIRVPVAVVVGDSDKLVEPEQSGRLHHVLPNAVFIPVRNAGHMVHHAAPERIVDAIDRVARPRALAPAA